MDCHPSVSLAQKSCAGGSNTHDTSTTIHQGCPYCVYTDVTGPRRRSLCLAARREHRDSSSATDVVDRCEVDVVVCGHRRSSVPCVTSLTACTLLSTLCTKHFWQSNHRKSIVVTEWSCWRLLCVIRIVR